MTSNCGPKIGLGPRAKNYKIMKNHFETKYTYWTRVKFDPY